MLEVSDLEVTYGGAVQALRGVSLAVPDRKVVAVLGSNGAGKTTLLRTISSTLRLHRGRSRPARSASTALAGRPGRLGASSRAGSCRCPRAGGSSAG